MTEMLIEVRARHFTAGIVLKNGRCVEAAPILAWAVTRQAEFLRSSAKAGPLSWSRDWEGTMEGKLIVYEPDSPTPKVLRYDEAIIADDLQDAVGGWLEVVPYFDTLSIDGDRKPCRAFCNEEGKLRRLDLNVTATQLWRDALTFQGLAGAVDDVLVGPVVIVFGDEQFMRQL